ncbi:peptidylprolyl isomerase [Tahibacter soli]|uniref:peptidylprolyl isomerase n=1 Tax=Tahibacter soli TaxID=2983605 RepID=A0A9X4BK92_9GAMM|nr:peptidylprolyl isomerase [Tahibacter soli]MDC8015911.1 peptidylprolyl isomerase [Tahibacter soli]
MRHLLVCSTAVLLAACSSEKAPLVTAVQYTAGNPAIRVNDQPISEALLANVAKGRNLDLTKPEQRQRAIKELSDYVILARAAEKSGLAVDPEALATIEAARLQGLANATLTHYAKTHPIADEMVKAEYDQQIQKAGTQSYDFTQLILDNEADAMTASAEILGGKAFQAVYDEWAPKTRQSKAYKGVRLAQLPAPEIADTLKSLKPGEATKVPLKTSFGWHLILLQAVNDVAPPPFEQVKNELRRVMIKRQGDVWMEKMRGESLILDLQTPQPAAAPAAPAAPAPAEPAKQG